MSIRLVPREEIDKTKWNSCVHYASNGSIFGYMWYLDAMARHWDGLVQGDYEAVMPLTPKAIRWGQEGLKQPPLIRETAIYSVNPPSLSRNKAFWAAIPEEYKVVDLQLDSFSQPREGDWTNSPQTNYYLPLSGQYEQIRERYSSDLIEQLAIAEAADLFPSSSMKPEKIAEHFRQSTNLITEQVFHGLQRIMYNILHRGWGFGTGVMNRDKEILAADFFIFSHGRIMSLAPSNTPPGHAVFAQQYMYDAIIRNNAGKPQALDFNAPFNSVEFAQSFGALDYEYFKVQRDKRLWGVF